ALPEPADAALSNSLVHHIPNPLQFWYCLKKQVNSGSYVLVMDLLRPESPEAAQAIVDQYAANEPPILRKDFYNSLLAAFTEDEVAAQLAELNLSRLMIDVIDDRHWVVGGRIY
ncbi:MAG: class I SAM-dependent methyltransferase, partial [Nitrospiraceae bacterium]